MELWQSIERLNEYFAFYNRYHKYFIKSYKRFIDDSRKALKNAGMDPTILKLDLNEITGLSAGYKNKTFSILSGLRVTDNLFVNKNFVI